MGRVKSQIRFDLFSHVYAEKLFHPELHVIMSAFKEAGFFSSSFNVASRRIQKRNMGLYIITTLP